MMKPFCDACGIEVGTERVGFNYLHDAVGNTETTEVTVTVRLKYRTADADLCTPCRLTVLKALVAKLEAKC